MKSNKRIAMVAILLIIAVAAVSAAPLMRNRQTVVQQPVAQTRRAAVQQPVAQAPRGAVAQNTTRAIQNRAMQQSQILRDDVLAQVPEELKALIEERRLEALQRQDAQRSEVLGQGFRGRSKGSMVVR